MREFVIAGCVVAVAACGGGGKAKQDSVASDTIPIAGPTATTAKPSGVSAETSSVGASTTTGAKSPPSPVAKTNAGRGVMPGRPLSGASPTPGAAPDSVRGTVSVVGTSFEKRVMIAAQGSGKRTEISGPLAPLIGHVAGADVSVVGTPSGTTLAATSFLVRTVDGAPAIDGTLKTEGSSLYIITVNGTRARIATPPPPLLGHDGARVWITGDPSKGVSSFGFIDPPR